MASRRKAWFWRGSRRRRWGIVSGGLAIALLGLLLSPFACSGRFNWNAPRPPAAPRDLLAGRWEGTWLSEKSNLSGALRAVITPQPDGTYLAAFRAQVVGPFNFDQEVTLTIEKQPSAWSFRGERDLGLLRGGKYAYEGTSDGTTYACRYKATMDYGKFEMKRVADPATGSSAAAATGSASGR